MIAGLPALGVEHHLDDARHASLGRFQAGDNSSRNFPLTLLATVKYRRSRSWCCG